MRHKNDSALLSDRRLHSQSSVNQENRNDSLTKKQERIMQRLTRIASSHVAKVEPQKIEIDMSFKNDSQLKNQTKVVAEPRESRIDSVELDQ